MASTMAQWHALMAPVFGSEFDPSLTAAATAAATAPHGNEGGGGEGESTASAVGAGSYEANLLPPCK